MGREAVLSAIMNIKYPFPLTSHQKKELWDFFSKRSKGEIIYPGHVAEKMGLDLMSTYHVLEQLKKQGFLKNRFEVICSGCHSQGIFLEHLNEFPFEGHCETCGKQLSLGTDLIVLYKLVDS